ncbi:cysteine proteinase inhibitor 5-like [Chenopodium quinoa]|uniref:Cystatin domain-containing protein n=1 Tax=Chenopodium quinoa TaxID=63459 RepID=A0A803M1L4_CHEQI|nr:cysteine proteinase inhibitor 5-like [Chenopodium quinoa]
MSTRTTLLVVLSLLAVIISVASAAGLRSGTEVGGFKPIENLGDPYVQDIAKFAVKEHNEQEDSHLGIEKIVKGEEQVVAGKNYRLTIAANDSHYYETVVYDKPWAKFRSLTYFRSVSLV